MKVNMPVSKQSVEILQDRVRQAIDHPTLDLVNSEEDVLAMVLGYGIKLKYVTSSELICQPGSIRIGGKEDGTVYVVTTGALPVEWMRARAICFAVLKQLGLSLDERAGK
jgi:hypothetical protein